MSTKDCGNATLPQTHMNNVIDHHEIVVEHMTICDHCSIQKNSFERYLLLLCTFVVIISITVAMIVVPSVYAARTNDVPLHGNDTNSCYVIDDNAFAYMPESSSRSNIIAPDSQQRCRIEGVHTDTFAVYTTNGQSHNLVLGTKADGVLAQQKNGARFNTDSLVFRLGDNARQSSRGLPKQYHFLQEATHHGDFWYIPQTQQKDVLWAGFSTESLQNSSFVDKTHGVKFTLASVRGPGKLFMWTDNFNSITPRLGSDGTNFPHEHIMQIPQHEHMNWAFTASGRYIITMRAEAIVDNEKKMVERQYVFDVGDISRSDRVLHAKLDVSAHAYMPLEGLQIKKDSILSKKNTIAKIHSAEPLILHATVGLDSGIFPQGWVDFTDSTTRKSLGTATVTHLSNNNISTNSRYTGQAILVVPSLQGLGDHSITARFVPQYMSDTDKTIHNITVRVIGEPTPKDSNVLRTTIDRLWDENNVLTGNIHAITGLNNSEATFEVQLGKSVVEELVRKNSDIEHIAVHSVNEDQLTDSEYRKNSAFVYTVIISQDNSIISNQWNSIAKDGLLSLNRPYREGRYVLIVRNEQGKVVALHHFDITARSLSGILYGKSANKSTMKKPIDNDSEYYSYTPSSTKVNNGQSTVARGNNTGTKYGNSRGQDSVHRHSAGFGTQHVRDTNISRVCTSTDFTVLDHGHVDIAAFSPTANTMRLVVQEDVTGSHVRRNPARVMFWVRPQAKSSRGFTLPQTQDSGLLWLGWNNQYLSNRNLPVTWTIDHITGPGSVRVWTQGGIGRSNTTILDSKVQRTFTIPANTHTHAYWDFSAQGYYAVTMTYDSPLGKDTQTLFFTVGSLNPHAMPISCQQATMAKHSNGIIRGTGATATEFHRYKNRNKMHHKHREGRKNKQVQQNADKKNTHEHTVDGMTVDHDTQQQLKQLSQHGGIVSVVARHPLLSILVVFVIGLTVGIILTSFLYMYMLRKDNHVA